MRRLAASVASSGLRNQSERARYLQHDTSSAGPGPGVTGEGRMVLTGKRRKPVVIIKGKGDKVSVLFCTALSAHAPSKKN